MVNINKLRILIISSVSPIKGPGMLASDYYKAYSQQGYEVDVLTKFRCEQFPEFLYVYDSPHYSGKLNFLFRAVNRLKRTFIPKSYSKDPHYFFYKKEEYPPVRIDEVLSKITKQYDIVQILFWQELLSFSTIHALYLKLKCMFFFDCVDYSPMSGGCHFIGDCKRYKIGCGCCPAYNSNDPFDFTWHNVNFRKKVYEEVDPIVTGNTYMFGFYEQSLLLKERKRMLTYPIIDTNIFRPHDKAIIRRKLKVSEQKRFVLLFGCQGITDERKGIKYLIESVNKFSMKLKEQERKQVLIMSVGNNFEKIRSQFIGLDTLDLGYVTKDELAEIYSFADVFLCSSVNDAGPMMVNQSICCGTPVVGFEMGSCLDAVKDKGTGYCAKLMDTDDYANGIFFIYNLTDKQKVAMSEACLKLARNNYTYEASVNRIVGTYYMLEKKR